ncbi:hypothetical protein SPHV1_390003 [Novosphingobium sp. KN65.2]|nr:hypothetical protein SPHV1_390003 [Novosphingobium sp. KN65.2]
MRLQESAKKAVRTEPPLKLPARRQAMCRCLRVGTGANIAALGDAGALTGTTAQVVQLGTTHDAAANHGDRIDVRRVQRENAFHAFTEADLADGEVRTHATVRTRDAHAFEVLDAGTGTFDDLHADADGVARTELRDILAGLGNFLGLDLLNQVHEPKSSSLCRAPEADWSRAPL